MKCQLCPREAAKGKPFCEYHQLAHEGLISAFKRWQEALEDLTWKSYLEHLVKLPETGVWVKEVAEMELQTLMQEGGEKRD